jgi:nucleoid DNA-binding protein
MLHSDIKENVMKETGISSKQYDVIVDDFWHKIREILSSPLQINLGLRLSTFGTWWLDIWKIKVISKNNPNPFKEEYNKLLIENLDKFYKTYKNEKKHDE